MWWLTAGAVVREPERHPALLSSLKDTVTYLFMHAAPQLLLTQGCLVLLGPTLHLGAYAGGRHRARISGILLT